MFRNHVSDTQYWLGWYLQDRFLPLPPHFICQSVVCIFMNIYPSFFPVLQQLHTQLHLFPLFLLIIYLGLSSFSEIPWLELKLNGVRSRRKWMRNLFSTGCWRLRSSSLIPGFAHICYCQQLQVLTHCSSYCFTVTLTDLSCVHLLLCVRLRLKLNLSNPTDTKTPLLTFLLSIFILYSSAFPE